MTTLRAELFGAYDIRGHQDDGIDGAFAHRLGNRIASHLGAGIVVVGRDGRLASKALADAVKSGLRQAGVSVVDVGYTASPHVYWAMRHLGAVGAIMVTASHNDDSYVGFKVVRRDGGVVPGPELLNILQTPEVLALNPGSLKDEDVSAEYAREVTRQSGWQAGEVIACGIDAPISVRQVLERIAPIAPSSELLAVFDSDADRVALYEHGAKVRADALGALLAVHLKAGAVVHDLRCSRAVLEYLHEHDVATHRCAVGRVAFQERMTSTGAFMGVELSGHMYWKSFDGVEAPEYALLVALAIMRQSGASLEALAGPMKKYASSDEISVPLQDTHSVGVILDRVARFGSGYDIDRLDGVTIDAWVHEGWWCNVRASHTEPVIRLVAEAKEKHLLDRVVAEVLALVRS